MAHDDNTSAWICRVCGCVDEDCRQCIEKTGKPCHWVEKDLCSACEENTLITPVCDELTQAERLLLDKFLVLADSKKIIILNQLWEE